MTSRDCRFGQLPTVDVRGLDDDGLRPVLEEVTKTKSN